MKTAIIIPARYGSTRFPGKPLALINGHSMLSRVVTLARKIADEFENCDVYVTTDDVRIADHANHLQVECLITSEGCASGSDRVLEAAEQLPEIPDIVINLQGDAPFTPKSALRQVIKAFQDNPSYSVVTPVHRLSWEDLDRLRANKKETPFSGTCAILDQDSSAIWFSKNIIPAIRKEDKMRESGEQQSPVYQHMGLYGYNIQALKAYCALPQGHYEQLEGLEQLRLIENKIPIHCVEIDTPSGTLQSGIDTPEDLARAEALLNQPG